MKTVKEYLSELNTTRLVDTLFEEFGDKLFDVLDEKGTGDNFEIAWTVRRIIRL